MKTQLLGRSALISTRLAYGCMRITGAAGAGASSAQQQKKSIASVAAAYEAGYRLFDHADIYGRGACETAFGAALKEIRGLRDGILIATKCGIRFAGDPDAKSPGRYDFSAPHILRSCEGSLRRMGIETIDLYQLHRPDALMDPDEIAGAFEQLRREGKVREFGVSNFSPAQFTALQSRLPWPLLVNQVRISLDHIACFEDGTLEQCLTERVTPLAWSPVGKGLLAEKGVPADAHPDKPRALAVIALLDEIAAEHRVTRTALSLAWLLKHPAHIIPIVGSANPEHIRAAAKADDLEISREEWYRLYVAARGAPLP